MIYISAELRHQPHARTASARGDVSSFEKRGAGRRPHWCPPSGLTGTQKLRGSHRDQKRRCVFAWSLDQATCAVTSPDPIQDRRGGPERDSPWLVSLGGIRKDETLTTSIFLRGSLFSRGGVCPPYMRGQREGQGQLEPHRNPCPVHGLACVRLDMLLALSEVPSPLGDTWAGHLRARR